MNCLIHMFCFQKGKYVESHKRVGSLKLFKLSKYYICHSGILALYRKKPKLFDSY